MKLNPTVLNFRILHRQRNDLNAENKMVKAMILLLIVAVYLCTPVFADDILAGPICSFCECNNATYSVNCSNNTNLKYIPEDPTGRTVLLNMSLTRLYVINSTCLSTYSDLQVLDVSRTLLRNISDSAFSGLKNLKYLNLSNNENLPMTQNTTSPELFRHLTSLIELKIYGNTGTYNSDGYPDKALSEMKHLNSLWVDGLTNVPFGPAFQFMESLKTIRIPGDIIQPPWRFCETNIVEGMLDNLIHVTNFTMRKCGIRCVASNAFRNMISLAHLDLSFNRFLTIDRMALALPSLANTKLTVLVLNAIENVLQLSCGPTITKNLAKTLSNITTLKELHVEYNAINGFERGAMENLPKSIEFINAKRNELELGFYAFDVYHLENLTKLDISYNFFPDDTEIWHRSPPSAFQKAAMTCVDAQKETDSASKGDESVIPVAFHRDIYKTSVSGYSTLEKNELNNILENTGENKYLHPEKNFIDILKTSTIRKPDLIQHLSEPMSINLKTDRESMKPYNGELADGKERVCPQTKPIIPAGTVIAYLPAKLKTLDLSHSKIAHPIPELFFNETNSIKEVIASNSLLFCWDGPIHGLTKLEYADLSLNYCTNVGLSFFDKFPSLKYLSIAKNLLFPSIIEDKYGRILRNLKKLEDFDMSFNRLRMVPRRFLINQANLKKIDLHENILVTFDVDVSHMGQLDTIDLSGNIINILPKEVRNNLTRISERNFKTTKTTLYVNLDGNPVLCYCNSLDFLQWIYDHMSTCRFLNVTISRCIYYNHTEIKIIDREQFGAVLEHLKTYCTSYTGVIIGVSVALCVLLNIGIGVLVHRFRWKIRYWYFVAPSKPISRSGYISIDSLSVFGSRYKYDIYVASTTDDRTFVMDTMKSRLENERLRLFIQDYDIVPGQNIYSIIANAIHVSRNIIFIISEGCDNDKEWLIAMRMAHEESLKRGQPVFFGIFIDHEPGTPYSSDVREIRQRSYVDYPGDSQPANEQTFWLEILEKITDSGNTEILTIE